MCARRRTVIFGDNDPGISPRPGRTPGAGAASPCGATATTCWPVRVACRRLRLVPVAVRPAAAPRLETRAGWARLDEVLGTTSGATTWRRRRDRRGRRATPCHGGRRPVPRPRLGRVTGGHRLPDLVDDQAGGGGGRDDPHRGCRLLLDEPIDPWIPELAHRHVLRRLDAPLDDVVNARRPITVRDCSPSGWLRPDHRRADAYPILPSRTPTTSAWPGPTRTRCRHPRRAAPARRAAADVPARRRAGCTTRRPTCSGVLIARVCGLTLGEGAAPARVRAARHGRHRLQRGRPPSMAGSPPRTPPTAGRGTCSTTCRAGRGAGAGVPVRRRRARLHPARLSWPSPG